MNVVRLLQFDSVKGKDMSKIQKLAAFVRSHSTGCMVVHKQTALGLVRPVLRIESHYVNLQDHSTYTEWVEVEPTISAVRAHLGY